MLKLKTNFLKYKDENGDMQDSGMLFAQNETDSTLTKSGVAADAQVVGEKLVTLSEQKVNKSGLTLDIHTDGLIYLFVDGKPTGNGFEVGTGTIVEGDVTGVLDENNNILLSGDLENGEYVLKWLDKDGNYVDAGTIVVGAIAPEEPEEPVEIINWIPNSINADGTPFVGTNGEKGYKTNTRMSISSGNEKSASGCVVTGYIPIKYGDTIYLKGITIDADSTTQTTIWYDSAFNKITTTNAASGAYTGAVFGDVAGEIVSITLDKNTTNNDNFNQNVAYIRITAGEINADSIITINQPIENTNFMEYNATNTTDWSLFCNDARIGSDGAYREAVDTNNVTNYIPVQNGDVVYWYDMPLNGQTIGLYDSNKANIRAVNSMSTLEDEGYIADATALNAITYEGQLTISNASIAFIRFTILRKGYTSVFSDSDGIINIKRNGKWL